MSNREKDTNTEVRTDWLGQQYRVGDMVIYGAGSGRSITMTLARVARLNPTGTVGVIPVKNSRWKGYGTSHYEDSRNGKRVEPFGKDYGNPEVVSCQSGYYDKVTGDYVGDRHSMAALKVGLDNLIYREFTMQPWIVRAADPPKVVTLVVTENITKWVDPEA